MNPLRADLEAKIANMPPSGTKCTGVCQTDIAAFLREVAGVSSSSSSSSTGSSSTSSNSSSNSSSGLGGLVNFPIGMAVAASGGSSDIFTNTARQILVTSDFSQISAENIMKMNYLFKNGNFTFTQADNLVDWASQNKLSVHGHALVWHSSYQLPSWATENNTNFKSDFENHITQIAQHFAGKVKSWDVVNEALYDQYDNPDNLPAVNGLRQSIFHRKYSGIEYISKAFTLARQADPNAELYYNDFNTEENGTKTTALVNMVTQLINAGVPIDGVGFQMHVLHDYPSITNIKAAMKKIVDLNSNLKIKITELDVRMSSSYNGSTTDDYKDRSLCANNNACAPFNTQKARYKEVINAYLEIVPPSRRGGITIWGIADPDSWFYTHDSLVDWPLLFNDKLEKKPAFSGIEEALKGT
jgi:endo-1,4-beta-xylanase